jgi:hypothetical protein
LHFDKLQATWKQNSEENILPQTVRATEYVTYQVTLISTAFYSQFDQDNKKPNSVAFSPQANYTD